jgi:hypothetical protein
MRKFPIRYLIFLNIVCLGLSCSQYRHMHSVPSDETCVQQFKPDFYHVIYKTSVDVVGKHLSGLLLIKNMPDSSTRIVFSNEMGFSFFDFGFGKDSGFKVFKIIPQMDKKALIKTLEKDFELLLFKNMDKNTSYAIADSTLIYHAYPQSRGINYYITDEKCSRLIKMQRASDTKPVMEAFIYNINMQNQPDSILIRHLNFSFTISLKKMIPIASE